MTSTARPATAHNYIDVCIHGGAEGACGHCGPNWVPSGPPVTAELRTTRPADSAAPEPLTAEEQAELIRRAQGDGFLFDRFIGTVPVFHRPADSAAPVTTAGRRLWRYLHDSIVTSDERRAAFLTDILAIEAEAAAAEGLDVERLARAIGSSSTGERPDGIRYNPRTLHLMAEEIVSVPLSSPRSRRPDRDRR